MFGHSLEGKSIHLLNTDDVSIFYFMFTGDLLIV